MREQILYNEMEMPGYKKFVSALGVKHADMARDMFFALWHQYLRNKQPINLTFWSDKFNDAKVMNTVLMSLAQANWIITHSIPSRNWAEAYINEDKLLEFVTMEELESVRARHKFAKYRLRNSESTVDNMTRVNGKTVYTGLVREGFKRAGNTKFRYNKHYMEQYKESIQLNLTKSMDKIAEQCPNLRHDRASYDTISIDILDFHIENENTVFTRGNNYNDSRGRAISSSLAKVANPISCKDFRALLVIPKESE